MEFLLILLPIFSVFLIGYIGQKRIGFDTKQLSTMALYLMSPFLVFRTFYVNTISIDYVYLILYTLGLSTALLFTAWVVGKVKKWDAAKRSGVMLASSFMNNGNYGAPLALFVFGAVGLDIAIILMVLQQLLMCTVGIFIAASGNKDQDVGAGSSMALKSVFRMPILYAALLGLALQVMNISLSSLIFQTVDFVADAAIPTIMIILGMQLAKTKIKTVKIEPTVMTVLIRLVASPVIAFLIVKAMPIDETWKEIMILMAATPTSANITLYALQFDTEPEFVSTATLITTVLSLATLPVVMWIMFL
ncbi:hypothetical protein CR194_13210 [Salipaludibacillus keqinensis]|uniref:Transporter n=1 Tax=Salipaludibacillus keqinensis TaxID=2045207 RepID=A0A323TIW5_9BACI|nr:AEC family transporter [Salipaludibacillus keqinensis]PYZ92623.1 hypothetical protein CR194_13210 [Salipaludibacillus keqinensis]